jgi:hypothetical protein
MCTRVARALLFSGYVNSYHDDLIHVAYVCTTLLCLPFSRYPANVTC